jgi:hypothetical protein
MTDAGNLVFCLERLAACDPDEVIEALKDWKYVTAGEKSPLQQISVQARPILRYDLVYVANLT